MTICIAMLCENNKKLVAVSDRMTTHEYLSIEFEHGRLKMDELSCCVLALTAGDALAHTDLFRDVVEEVSLLAIPDVRSVAGKVEETFSSARQTLAEKETLLKAGMSYGDFIDQQQKLNPDLVLGLTRAYQDIELEVEIIVAGVDSSGAHIYSIEDPGIANCCDALGFMAIGSGLPHAVSFITEANYSASISLNEALWLTYEAKRRGERAPGVGSRFTDVAIIDEIGIFHLDRAAMKQLEDIHQTYKDKLVGVGAEIDKMVNALHTEEGTTRGGRHEQQKKTKRTA
jgi:hypothetical protein